MARAGKALRQVLEAHGISQNRLAVAMGLGRSTINNWYHETRDPSAEAVLEIIEGLQKIDRDVAKEFVKLYLGQIAQDSE